MEAILKRDQRTTSHRVFDCCEKKNYCHNCNNIKIINNKRNNIDNYELSMTDKKYYNFNECNNNRKTKNLKRNTIKDRYFNSTIMRLVFSVTLMLLMIPAQSAPSIMVPQSMRKRFDIEPSWYNPCGMEIVIRNPKQPNSDRNLTEGLESNVTPVLSLIKQAYLQADKFRDRFIADVLKISIREAGEIWKDIHYEFLPSIDEIPKTLGKRLPADYLEKFELRMLDDLFLNAFTFFQQYAVGVEQLVWDHKDHRTQFFNDFDKMKNHLNMILCEIQLVLIDRSLIQKPDVTRDVMPLDIRITTATVGAMRDWIIFRDYMNSLEFFIEIFDHLLYLVQN